jgi:hypothetical protein
MPRSRKSTSGAQRIEQQALVRMSRSAWKAITTRLGAATIIGLLGLLLALLAWIRPDPLRTAPQPTPPTTLSSSQPPVTVATAINPVRQIRARTGDRSFFFAQPATALSSLSPNYVEDDAAVLAWGYGQGGADADITLVSLIVQGRDAKSVVLTDLIIKVLRRSAPPRGTYVKVTPGADGIDTRAAEVNLDKPAPALSSMYDPETERAWSFPLRVSESAVEAIDLWAGTGSCDCLWTAQLHFVADGKPGVVPITNNGKPFRTVASENSVRYGVIDGKLVKGREP